MKIRYIIAFVFAFSIGNTFAQSNQPAPNQAKPILLMNGIAHLGNGEVIKNSAIGFENGKLTMVVDATVARIDMSKFEVVKIEGQHVYPGFILPNSELGLREVNAVRATVDAREAGDLKPNVRSVIAYNTDSELITTFKHNGILTTQIVPSGGTISGTSSIVQLDAWNWEDAVIKEDDGIHLNWPARKIRPRWWMGETEYQVNKEYDNTVAKIQKLFSDAKAYSENNGGKTNIKLEAMLGLYDGSKQLFIHENAAKSILESVQFAKNNAVKKIVVVGGRDVSMITEFIKDNDISVVLNGVHIMPSREESDVDMPYKTPALLQQAGIKFCIAYGGSIMNHRNLPFLAGTAAAYGLSKEEALKTITSNAAEILGLANLGVLKEGYRATLFVSEGDALDMRTNNVIHAFIDGRNVKTDGMQEILYERYKEKYGQE
ncbi:MAG: amidohydrolase family protein [Cyclobacteriaceae bacterium]|nr:amidohydrolase family protein [Cyclobacteriaceae bacterium]